MFLYPEAVAVYPEAVFLLPTAVELVPLATSVTAPLELCISTALEPLALPVVSPTITALVEF